MKRVSLFWPTRYRSIFIACQFEAVGKIFRDDETVTSIGRAAEDIRGI